MEFKTAYSLDDILLVPQPTEIKSRLDTDLTTRLTTNIDLKIPIMATNMSTITEYEMMKAMSDLGGVGALHRFLPLEDNFRQIEKALKLEVNPIIASIGVGPHELNKAIRFADYNMDILMIDVAHAHSDAVLKQLELLVDTIPQDIIVGNVATGWATKNLIELGANAIRVGIGGGSRCTTRTVTGHGVPNLTALIDCVAERDKQYEKTGIYVPIIMDGGLKTSGDIVKALYFGADVCSLGGMLAGTAETPGELFSDKGDYVYKKYYGMASKEAQDTHRNGLKNGTAPEGFSQMVPFRGSVKPIVEDIIGGVRSGLTYSGAINIEELRQRGEPIYLSPGARTESKL